MIEDPFVTIITPNWNGSQFLRDWLPSITSLNYSNYEVIVVDNNSSDNSISYIKKNYPQVRILENKTNRGFAGGNNDGIRLAIKEGRAKYIALINNDTIVDRNWLKAMVDCSEEDTTTGAIGSKILFLKPFVEIAIQTTIFRPSDNGSSDRRELGAKIWNSPYFSGTDYKKIIWKDGFYGEEKYPGQTMRWTNKMAKCLIPVEKGLKNYTLNLELEGHKNNQTVEIFINQKRIKTLIVCGKKSLYTVNIERDLIDSNAHFIIQNAGSVLDEEKYEGGDRGTGEVDEKQYDKVEELKNLCGASLLVPISVLKEVGYFDEYFFMYYEDTDLTQRIRKAGYKLIYEPKSIVYHVHTGSSVEWSPFFIYQVERNRIACAIKNAKPKIVILLSGRIIKIWIHYLLEFLKGQNQTIRLKTYTKILISLVINTPQLILKRLDLKK